tara:strand:- start:4351 stop:4611 length:261 start_codon:yes stop_codon:yes gene_type:complete
MKLNKYWFGKQFLFSSARGGFFIPISWEGWIITTLLLAYLLSVFIFHRFYLDNWLFSIFSTLLIIIPYFLIGYKKQNPKDKNKMFP